MALLATFWLRILHIFYSLILFVYSGCKRLTAASPQPLDAVRRRIPKHLAVVLVIDPNASSEDIEKSLTGTIVKLVGWCRVIGTQKLTVYEEHGRLIERVHRIREIFSNDCSEQDSSESEIDYPPTPPLSDCSESRPLLPQDIDGSFFSMNTESIHIAGKTCSCESSSALRSLSHDCVPHKSLTLCLASRRSSKQAIATVACLFASRQHRKSRRTAKHTKNDGFKLSIDALNASLEADSSLSSPDFLISHSGNTLLELHGYPPWHIRLTEIYHNTIKGPPPMFKWLNTRNSSSEAASLDELSFRQALDEFAAAEMRFGT